MHDHKPSHTQLTPALKVMDWSDHQDLAKPLQEIREPGPRLTLASMRVILLA